MEMQYFHNMDLSNGLEKKGAGGLHQYFLRQYENLEMEKNQILKD